MAINGHKKSSDARAVPREEQDVIRSHQKLADLYVAKKAFLKAAETFRKIEKMLNRHLVPEHPLVLKNLERMAGAYQRGQSFKTAESILSRVLRTREKALEQKEQAAKEAEAEEQRERRRAALARQRAAERRKRDAAERLKERKRQEAEALREEKRAAKRDAAWELRQKALRATIRETAARTKRLSSAIKRVKWEGWRPVKAESEEARWQRRNHALCEWRALSVELTVERLKAGEWNETKADLQDLLSHEEAHCGADNMELIPTLKRRLELAKVAGEYNVLTELKVRIRQIQLKAAREGKELLKRGMVAKKLAAIFGGADHPLAAQARFYPLPWFAVEELQEMVALLGTEHQAVQRRIRSVMEWMDEHSKDAIFPSGPVLEPLEVKRSKPKQKKRV